MFDLATPLQEQVLSGLKRKYGENHPDTVEGKHALACTYVKQYRLDAAKQLALEVLSARKHIYGQEHPKTQEATEILAVIRYKQGQMKRACKGHQSAGSISSLTHSEVMQGTSRPTAIYVEQSQLDTDIMLVLSTGIARIAQRAMSETSTTVSTQAQADVIQTSGQKSPNRQHEVSNTTSANSGFERAIREAYIGTLVANTKHPNIMALTGVALFQDQLALISPWMSNGTLLAYIFKHPDVDRWQLCQQVTEGLVCIHGLGMVHGDLKAANVFVSDVGIAKIGDFGNAFVSSGSSDFTATSNVGGGTSRWMARELLLSSGGNDEEVSDRSMPADVFALGMTVLTLT
ncbi:hypothetical protein FRC07_000090 [Ceratobasidium sp. 392]|nr:hypothetical protein FRC07_000090 [Ceratobasidium sp. 392]